MCVAANANNMVFWLLVHLLQSPVTLGRVRNEIQGHDESATEFDPKSLPVLYSATNETLRHCVSALSVREVKADCSFTGGSEHIAFQAGAQIAAVVEASHFEAAIWGDSVSHWNGTRFVEDESLANRLHPFGGGPSMVRRLGALATPSTGLIVVLSAQVVTLPFGNFVYLSSFCFATLTLHTYLAQKMFAIY